MSEDEVETANRQIDAAVKARLVQLGVEQPPEEKSFWVAVKQAAGVGSTWTSLRRRWFDRHNTEVEEEQRLDENAVDEIVLSGDADPAANARDEEESDSKEDKHHSKKRPSTQFC